MRIIITGSLGNVAKPLAQQLIAEAIMLRLSAAVNPKKVKLRA